MASTSAFSSADDVVDRRLTVVPQSATDASDLPVRYETARCCGWIQDRNFQKVALQFPDELLVDAAAVQWEIQKMVTASVFILGDTSYGSCCVDEVAAEHYQADCIIHFGPTCLSPTRRLPVLYVLFAQPVDTQDAADQFQVLFPDQQSKVILMADTVYHHAVEPLFQRLKESYTNVVSSYLRFPDSDSSSHDEIKEDSKDAVPQEERSSCDHCKCNRHFHLPQDSCLDEYSIFYIGSEGLALTNLMMTLNRCAFFTYCPCSRTGRKETLNVNKALMKRYYMIERAKDASIVGIVVGTLGVAHTQDMISYLKTLLRSAGKKSYTFVVGKLNPAKLGNFMEVDVFVLVACPQNSLLDSREFYRPIVTPFEMDVACNQAREWTGDYVTDFLQLLPGAAHHIPMQMAVPDSTDVSLISNKLRSMGQRTTAEGDDQGSTAVVLRSEAMAVTTVSAETAGEFLSARSWRGLERKLGETPVEKAKEGRSGIALGYENEPQ
ncbi:hypothetical protein BaRGS_00000421 [Batillaria attramentaria]|uniref:2-(3-amino-3-carboxypropyl)histidine synthase subunit 2 n=1 Tax=Batillaria attramentaria TaxID=370345 RepID=A0ABD0M9V6_9CAEN